MKLTREDRLGIAGLIPSFAIIGFLAWLSIVLALQNETIKWLVVIAWGASSLIFIYEFYPFFKKSKPTEFAKGDDD